MLEPTLTNLTTLFEHASRGIKMRAHSNAEGYVDVRASIGKDVIVHCQKVGPSVIGPANLDGHGIICGRVHVMNAKGFYALDSASLVSAVVIRPDGGRMRVPHGSRIYDSILCGATEKFEEVGKLQEILWVSKTIVIGNIRLAEHPGRNGNGLSCFFVPDIPVDRSWQEQNIFIAENRPLNNPNSLRGILIHWHSAAGSHRLIEIKNGGIEKANFKFMNVTGSLKGDLSYLIKLQEKLRETLGSFNSTLNHDQAIWEQLYQSYLSLGSDAKRQERRENIGRRVTALRMAADEISQTELAKRAELGGHSSLDKIESGKSYPRCDTVVKLARALALALQIDITIETILNTEVELPAKAQYFFEKLKAQGMF